jgi:aryl-alcohol dehydrogenase-like predicted oxidoreductase
MINLYQNAMEKCAFIKRSAETSEEDSYKIMDQAMEYGINFFDTARLYGTSEAVMGKAFKDRRDRVVICTKCSHFRDEHGELPDSGALKKIIEISLHESLTALQSDFVDIYMLHQADVEILSRDDIAETFLHLKKQGVIRATGVSTYKTEETKKAVDSGAWDVVQLPFNLMDQSQETQFSAAAQNGVGIVIRSVLFKGILSAKGRNLHPALKNVEAHLKLYGELLSESVPDLPTLATKFALSFKEVSSVLVGIDRMEYLQKALAAADGQYLDEKTLARARELRYPQPDFLDLPKWDRKGWLR